MATVFRKTDLGTREITTRAAGLTPRLRSLLILVDGRRSDAELEALVTGAREQLAQLAERGLVEALRRDAASPSGAPAAASVAVASGPPSTLPGASPTLPGPPVDVPALRREMVRALTDLLGPGADSLALRIERAKTGEELATLLALGRGAVEGMRGREAAARFAAAFSDRLPPAAAAR